MVARNDELRVGDRVEFQWAWGRRVGRVVRVYGPAQSRHALVEVPILGAGGEPIDHETLALPVDDLKRVKSSA